MPREQNRAADLYARNAAVLQHRTKAQADVQPSQFEVSFSEETKVKKKRAREDNNNLVRAARRRELTQIKLAKKLDDE